MEWLQPRRSNETPSNIDVHQDKEARKNSKKYHETTLIHNSLNMNESLLREVVTVKL